MVTAGRTSPEKLSALALGYVMRNSTSSGEVIITADV